MRDCFASFLKEGWTRKDILSTVSLRGVQRERRLLACARSRLRNLRVPVGTKGDGEIAAASLGWPRNDIK